MRDPHSKYCHLSKWTSFYMAFLASLNTTAFAAQTLIIHEQERLSVTFSAQDLNRVQIVGDRIASVFGPPQTFSLEHEEVKGQVFVKVHDGAPAQFDLSVVGQSGRTQDLRVRVIKGEGQTVLLQPSQSPSDLVWSPEGSLPLSEPINLIGHMVRAEGGSGYLRQSQTRSLKLWRDLDLKLIETWKRDGLEGRVYEVKNTGDATIRLQESQLLRGSNTQALALSDHTVRPGTHVLLYEVIRHG